jgi:hypothetical protein
MRCLITTLHAIANWLSDYTEWLEQYRQEAAQ